MDFLTCAFILPVVMNNLIYSKSTKHCGNLANFEKETATLFVPSVSISTQLKGCSWGYLFFLWCGKAPDAGAQLIHTTDLHHTTESDFVKNLCLKTSVAWGNSVDEQWTQLDDKVNVKLHICATLAETPTPLQESIYDAANIFGHLQPKKEEPCWTKPTN